MTEHDRASEDLAAFALGALSPPEAERLEGHLEECERCRAELRWLSAAVEALPSTVEQLEPPSRLRRRVLKAVRAEAAPGGGWPARVPVARPAVALGAVLAVLAAGGLGYALRGGGLERQTVALEAARGAPPGATGDLVRYDGAGTLELRTLPPLRGGDVYQAWVRRGPTIEPSAVFVPARDGSASAGVGGLEGADRLMITREPAGGSRHPSSAPIFRAPLN